MLARAKEKHVYDALIKTEWTEFLHAHPDGFDLIVSAATLVYFGDLKDVFAGAPVAGLVIRATKSAAARP